MALTSSMQDYLEAVLMVQQKRGYARCVDISHHLSVTMPSVSRAVKGLSKMGCLMKEADGTLFLTEQGKQLAEQIYEKHRFFTERLIAAGVDPKTAERDACNIEHAISAEAFQKLKEAAAH